MEKQLNCYVKEELQKQLKIRKSCSRRISWSLRIRRWKSWSYSRSKCRNRFRCKNEEFKTFVANVAKQVAEKNPENLEALLAQESIEEAGKTVNEVLIGKIATIGENMNIRRFARFESEGLVEKYIHGDGKIAVLVNMKKGDKEVAKDVCMQIAAAKPEYLNEESVPADRVEKEKEILKAQTMNEGKPEAIAEKSY